MKFIHTADVHLHPSLKHVAYLQEEDILKRQYELRETFYRLLERAEKEACDALFIVGDLFDHPDINPFELEALFKRLNALKLNVYIIFGNHDAWLFKQIKTLNLDGGNIHLFDQEKTTYSLGNTLIHGFNTETFTQTNLKALSGKLNQDKQHILLLHGEIINPNDDHFLIDKKSLRAMGFDYIALGHIHKHQFLTNHIAYSGNPEPFDFSEQDEKGVILGTLENHKLETTFIKTQKRHFITKTITTDETTSLDQLIEICKKSFDEKTRTSDFIRIVLKGEKHLDAGIEQKKLLDILKPEFYYLEIKDETEDAFDIKPLKKEYKDTVIERLIEAYEAKEKKNQDDLEALKKALHALLKTEVSW